MTLSVQSLCAAYTVDDQVLTRVTNPDGGRNYAYIRVSTDEQDLSVQREMVQQYKLWDIFEDKVSAVKIDERFGLQALIRIAGEKDVIYVPSVDRLGRDTLDVLELTSNFRKRGVTVIFCREGITLKPDAIDIIAEFMLATFATFAQIERNFIKCRQRDGIERAKSRGVYKGRKPIGKDKVQSIQRMYGLGISKAMISRELGISRTTVGKYTRDVRRVSMIDRLDKEVVENS